MADGAMVTLLPWRYRSWPHLNRPPICQVSRSKPFCESGAGRYTHRVRSAALYSAGGRSHLAVKLWCGAHLCIGVNHPGSQLTDAPSGGRLICATCEGRAIGAGQLGAREIAGRAVRFAPIGASHG